MKTDPTDNDDKPVKKTTGTSTSKKRAVSRAKPPEPPKKAESKSPTGLLVAAAALVVGVGVGWFVRDANVGVDAGPDPEAMVAPDGSAAPGELSPACQDWTTALCEGAGEQSEGCVQARAAASILPGSACAAAKGELPATLEKLKTARSACDELVNKLCADIGEQTETCKMVREKTPNFPTKQCTDMMANYDSVIGELKQMEAKNAPLTPEVAAAQRAGDAPSFGPADAKVAVVEYSDFECPFCGRAAETVKQLKEKYGDSVRFVFRQYPLPMHQNAPLAAEASLAAHAQGKFWPMHDAMFANMKALDRASLEKYAEEAGLDMAQFKKDLDENKYADEVKADMKLGEQIGVSGTPTMIVGTKRVSNPTDFASVSKLIDEELTAAGEPVPAK